MRDSQFEGPLSLHDQVSWGLVLLMLYRINLLNITAVKMWSVKFQWLLKVTLRFLSCSFNQVEIKQADRDEK